jgi:hypothetical protein
MGLHARATHTDIAYNDFENIIFLQSQKTQETGKNGFKCTNLPFEIGVRGYISTRKGHKMGLSCAELSLSWG